MASADEVLRVKREVDRLKQELAGVDGELRQVHSRPDAKADIPKMRAEFAALEKKRDALLAEFWKRHAELLGPAREA